MGIGNLVRRGMEQARERLRQAAQAAQQAAQAAQQAAARRSASASTPERNRVAHSTEGSRFESSRRAPVSLDARSSEAVVRSFLGRETTVPQDPPRNLEEARTQREALVAQAQAAEQAVEALEQINRERPSGHVRMELDAAQAEVARAYREAGKAAAREIDFFARPPRSVEAMEAYAQLVGEVSTHPSYAAGIDEGTVTVAQEQNAPRVDAAVEAVQRAYDEGGPLAAAQALETQAELLGSPELVDALIERSQPVIEEISRTLAERVNEGHDDSDESPITKGSIASLARVADLASDAGVAALVRPLAAALPDGNHLNQFDDAFNELDQTGAGARLGLALSNELESIGKTRTAGQIRSEALDAVNHVRGEYEEARTAREEADARLQQMLAEVQGLLTPEEQSAFIEAFRRENAAVYAAEAEAAQRLSDTLTQNAAAIDQMVVDDPSTADDVYDAYEELAQSPLPAAAVEWAARTMQAGSPTLEAFSDRAGDIQTNIVERGLPGTLSQYQAEADGDAGTALDRFENLFNQFKTARGFANAPGEFLQSLDDAQQYIDAMRAAQQGRPEALQQLLADREKLGRLSGVGSSIAAASLVFGITNLPGQSGADLVRAVGELGADGLQLAAKAIGTLEATGRLASSSRLVTGAAFLNARVLPGLGVALSAFSTIDAVGDFLRDGGNRNALKAVTSAVTLVGGALSLFPPTAPIGVVLAVVSTAVGLIGEAIFGADDRRRFNEEQQRLLEPILTDSYGDTESVREAARQIAFGDLDMNALKESTGLSNAEFVELMGTVPHANDRHFPHLVEVLVAAGVEPGPELLETVQALNEEFDGDLQFILIDLITRESFGNPAETAEQREARLAIYGEQVLRYLE